MYRIIYSHLFIYLFIQLSIHLCHIRLYNLIEFMDSQTGNDYNNNYNNNKKKIDCDYNV